jgi:Spy/CpxP family protein refolding chaperone
MMKKIIIAVLMISAVATMSPADRARQMQTFLKLTDTQTAKVSTVLQQLTDAAKNDKATQARLKSDYTVHNMKPIYTYMLKNMDEVQAKIDPILTPEQRKTYDSMLAKTRENIQKAVASQQ